MYCFFSEQVFGSISTTRKREMEMVGADISFSKKKKQTNKQKRGGNEMPLRGPRVRANPMPSLMAHAVAGLTPCPVVRLTRLGGSTTTDAPKKHHLPTSRLQLQPWGLPRGGPWCRRLAVPGLTRRGAERAPAERGGAQQVPARPRWVPTSPTEPAGASWRHRRGLAEASPHNPEIPLA